MLVTATGAASPVTAPAAALTALTTETGCCYYSCNGNPLSLLLLQRTMAAAASTAATAATAVAWMDGRVGWVRVACNLKM